MKFVILLGDGMADHPIESLEGKTPLEAARTPGMDEVAALGKGGLATTVPEGMPPGSDVANLSVMGYDPRRYYSGRAPLEAAAMNVTLGEEDVAFRCNLVNVDLETGKMVDYSAGHITTEENEKIVASLQEICYRGELCPGVGYRNLLVLREGESAECTPPHDIMGQPIEDHLPRGEGSDILRDMMEASVPLLARHPVNQKRIAAGRRPANMIWLWGQGKAPNMPRFREMRGIKGAMISAVDLLKGIGKYAGLEVIDVPGATGLLDTNYEGKVRAALDALARVDFVYLHVEAPDEMGLLEGLRGSGYEWRVCVLPDHPTPVALRTHTSEPVPFAMVGAGIEADEMRRFGEKEAEERGSERVMGWELVGWMVGE